MALVILGKKEEVAVSAMGCWRQNFTVDANLLAPQVSIPEDIPQEAGV
jgi:hypothetical protein